MEVLLFLARLSLDGRPAVHHVDTPLHLHVLLAFLQGLDEKLPVISPDQTCLKKKRGGDRETERGQEGMIERGKEGDRDRDRERERERERERSI